MVVVVWFNDYRTTKMYKSQIFKFLKNLDTYAVNFKNVVGLEKAAQGAMIYFGSSLSKWFIIFLTQSEH